MKKVEIILLAVVAILTIPALTVVADAGNLVCNPSLEELDKSGFPKYWGGAKEEWSSDERVSRSGKRSMRTTRTDPSSYKFFCRQTVECKPGKIYTVSAWIKTQDVKGSTDPDGDNTATICMEWRDKNGKWSGGVYPSGFTGTSDWRKVSKSGIAIPTEVGRVSVTLYMRPGMTGTAWYDDVEIVEEQSLPIRTMLLEPNYRGWVLPEGTQRIRAKVWLSVDEEEKLQDMELVVELRDGKVHKVVCQQTIQPTTEQLEVSLDLRLLEPGTYSFDILLFRKGGSAVPIARSEHEIEKLDESLIRKVKSYVAPDNTLVVEGKPFFVLGWFEWAHAEESKARVREMAGGPFNTILNYNVNSGSIEQITSYLDEVHARGMKLIYSIKDFYPGTIYYPSKVGPWSGEEEMTKNVVKTFKAHPAILAWYLNDELGPEFLPQLTEHYQWVSTIDRDHPCFVVLCRPAEFDQYLSTMDILGIDPYPIPERPVTMVSEWMEIAQAAVQRARPIWIVPQAFSHVRKTGEERWPTYEEIRCMSYLGLIHGAKGLIYYSYFDLKGRAPNPKERWDLMVKIATEIKEQAPIILSQDSKRTVKVSPEGSIHFMLKDHGGKLYLFAANPTDKSLRASFSFQEPVSELKPVSGEKKVILSEDGRSFTAEFDRFDVQVYETKVGH